MSNERQVPIFLGEGDEQIQIGTATLEDWKHDWTQLLIILDVFPGELASIGRIVRWPDVVMHSNYLHKKEEQKMPDEITPEQAAERVVELDPPPADLAEKVKKELEG